MSRILVIGKGGREHALVWRLAREAEVIAAPGNPGIAELCELRPLSDERDPGMLLELCKTVEPSLVLFGPEAPLIAGMADALRESGYACFGPGREHARLEGSKAFAKQLMRQAGVPTARFQVFTEPGPARDFARQLFDKGSGAVVKASGNALGKGVIVCESKEQSDEVIAAMLVRSEFGEAAREIVIEERLGGFELSLMTIVSGSEIRSLPVCRDYKRLMDEDKGPNTGGMGSLCSDPRATPELVARAEERIVRPILAQVGPAFRGLLFSGLMVDAEGPKCLEYNVRFGDPETQSLVRVVEGNLAGCLEAASRAAPLPELRANGQAAVSVVLASEGYPGTPKLGKRIELGSLPEGAVCFHAGTAMAGTELVTAGGRVLALSAMADTLQAARDLAYAALAKVRFEGMTYRTDIGA